MKTCILFNWLGYAGTYKPTFPYEHFVAVQEAIVRKRLEGTIAHDVFIVTSHPPTITLGRRGLKEQLASIKPLPEHIKKSDDPDDKLLEKAKSYLWRARRINLVKTNRGGSVWYHDHGVLQLYLIAEIEPFGISDIIYLLEEILLRTLADFGVAAARADAEARREHKYLIGLWAHGEKIAAIGIRVQKTGDCFVSMFGASLNVRWCKANSALIDPCGIPDCRMTSVAQELHDDYRVSHSMLLPLICQHVQCMLNAILIRR